MSAAKAATLPASGLVRPLRRGRRTRKAFAALLGVSFSFGTLMQSAAMEQRVRPRRKPKLCPPPHVAASPLCEHGGGVRGGCAGCLDNDVCVGPLDTTTFRTSAMKSGRHKMCSSCAMSQVRRKPRGRSVNITCLAHLPWHLLASSYLYIFHICCSSCIDTVHVHESDFHFARALTGAYAAGVCGPPPSETIKHGKLIRAGPAFVASASRRHRSCSRGWGSIDDSALYSCSWRAGCSRQST